MFRLSADSPFDVSPLSLPEGARTGSAKGVMVEVPAGLAPPVLSLWTAEPGSGTPVIWSDSADMTWAYLGAQHPRTRSRDALSAEWLRRLLATPTAATELSGVFALIVVDKDARRTLIVGDRLGVQALHHGVDAAGTWRASTHLLWLLLANGHDGAVDEGGFLTHMAFGYGVDPHRDVYRGIQTVPPSGYVGHAEGRCTRGVYWRPPEPSPSRRLEDVGELIGAVQSGMRSSIDAAPLFLGLTAGKDSLCLAAAAPPGTPPHTGTLGAAGCADQVQAAQIAASLGWPHVSGGVCETREFFEWADYTALHSAGLATVSYVDMAAFVAGHVPRGSVFVMGEGGECVRDFFQAAGRTPLDRLVTDYMTPAAYLNGTLATGLARQLDGYPSNLIADLRAVSGARDDDRFVSYFYRFQRMAGNFSLRNAVLGSIRPKASPFLDSHFIDATYALSIGEHAESAIHRRIIMSARPELLPFFDAPVRSARSTQEWPARFRSMAGPFRARLQGILGSVEEVLNPAGVLALCEAALVDPGRAVYHLFRLYSFTVARAMLRVGASERLRSIEAECLPVSGRHGRPLVPAPPGLSHPVERIAER